MRASFQHDVFWRNLMKMHDFDMQCKYNDIWGANVSFETNLKTLTVTICRIDSRETSKSSNDFHNNVFWNSLGCQIALVVVEVVTNSSVLYHVGWKFTKHKISIHFFTSRANTTPNEHETTRDKTQQTRQRAQHSRAHCIFTFLWLGRPTKDQ